VNKTILIAGGASLASLTVGVAGGYLIAKKRFEAGLGEIIENETEGIKKHYAVLLMEAYSGKPKSPTDIPNHTVVTENEEETPEDQVELTTKERRIRERGNRALADAANALTNYQGISTKIVSEGGEKPAISSLPKKVLPPRGDGGKFRKKSVREEEHGPPEIIDEEAFLQNDLEHEQESLLYFVNDRTLVMEADPTEVVDIALAGEVNLTLFPQVPEGEASSIYVRNEALGTDYEIRKMDESLTDYIGLGDNSDGEDEDSARYL
jgi:hypothetical protein